MNIISIWLITVAIVIRSIANSQSILPLFAFEGEPLLLLGEFWLLEFLSLSVVILGIPLLDMIIFSDLILAVSSEERGSVKNASIPWRSSVAIIETWRVANLLFWVIWFVLNGLLF